MFGGWLRSRCDNVLLLVNFAHSLDVSVPLLLNLLFSKVVTRLQDGRYERALVISKSLSDRNRNLDVFCLIGVWVLAILLS